jgi:homoprotocatechuate degradation regulator HpaR
MPSLPQTKRSLPITLMHAREHAMSPIREMLADTGISEQQWRILRVLSEHGRLDATTISEHACLLLSSLTRILRGMDQKGLIRRFSDQDDLRRQWVEITQEGQKILDDCHATADAIIAEFKSRLGEDRYTQLLDILNAFSASCRERPISLMDLDIS